MLSPDFVDLIRLDALIICGIINRPKAFKEADDTPSANPEVFAIVANCDNANATDDPPEAAAVLQIAMASAWDVVVPEAAAKTFALPMTDKDVADVPEEAPDVLMVVMPISMLAVDVPDAAPVVDAIDLAAADAEDMPSATAVVLMVALTVAVAVDVPDAAPVVDAIDLAAAVAVDVPDAAPVVSKIVFPIWIPAVDVPDAIADVLAIARDTATHDEVPAAAPTVFTVAIAKADAEEVPALAPVVEPLSTPIVPVLGTLILSGMIYISGG
jgi:hypothetical protein